MPRNARHGLTCRSCCRLPNSLGSERGGFPHRTRTSLGADSVRARRWPRHTTPHGDSRGELMRAEVTARPWLLQDGFDVRFEWGPTGTAAVEADAVVTVDVLRFTTAVDVAVSRGATVFPYRWKDASAGAVRPKHRPRQMLGAPRRAGFRRPSPRVSPAVRSLLAAGSATWTSPSRSMPAPRSPFSETAASATPPPCAEPRTGRSAPANATRHPPEKRCRRSTDRNGSRTSLQPSYVRDARERLCVAQPIEFGIVV